ncbi:MAG: pentapeptide repeat-containing protein [Candidatus Zixiibacteriota bacterium]
MALQEARSGECNFEGCIFNGNLSFPDVHFHGETSFKSAQFHGDVDFSSVVFFKKVDFSDSQFAKSLDCSGGAFGKDVLFTGVQFAGDVNFSKRAFEDYADFSEAKFRQHVNLRDTLFKDEARFTVAEFHGQKSVGMHGYEAVDVSQATFEGKADFTGSKFPEGNAVLNSVNFSGVEANFTDCEFGGKALFKHNQFKGNCFFLRTKFSGGTVSFEESEFTGERISFQEAGFSGGETSFYRVKFAGGQVSFVLARFTKGQTSFALAEFSCESISFISSAFAGSVGSFTMARFSGDVTFRDVDIECDIDFDEVRFSPESNFQFESPNFASSESGAPRLLFRRIRFIPLQTFFDNVKTGDQFAGMGVEKRPILLFRQCQLKDVFFSNSDMRLFSFFNSVFFEESHISTNTWEERSEKLASFLPVRFTRKVQIVEEELLEQKIEHRANESESSKIDERFQTPLLANRCDVADLYRRYKTASDRGKDYGLASWFYFNEFEMKRLAFRDRLDKARVAQEKLPLWLFLKCRWWLYTIYRVLAGYGEKPLWSFLWLCFFVGVFAVLNLFNGFTVPDRGTINYDLQLSLPNLGRLLYHFAYAILITLQRFIPISYTSTQIPLLKAADTGILDIGLALLNTVVLVIMIVFTGIGLKRHFRRF